MKANELMIGDIVRVTKDVCIPKGTIVSIKGIDADNRFIEKHLVGSATCLPINNEDGTTGGVWVEYLEPIPLTSDILEKNGAILFDSFARIKIGSHYILYAYAGFLTICNEDDNIRKISCLCCCFVHQLQHALKLCGINKDIVI